MWLIVGLGNPGSKYERTRHNIGFRVLDRVVARCGLSAFRKGKHGGDVTQGQLGAAKVVLLKPMEFMNVSGFAVQRTCAFHHIRPEQIVVVHDEIDQEFGFVRLKSGGGHGGHNGLRSMIDQLGVNSFARVRVGVGKPPRPPGSAANDRDVANWVLGDFSAAQALILDRVIDSAVDAVLAVVDKGIGNAMNARNGLAIIQ